MLILQLRSFIYISLMNYFLKIFKFTLLFCFIFLISNSVFSQKEKTSTEKQALFIYNFFKFVEWSNYNELKSFNVGIIGDNKDLVYNELQKIAKNKKAKELPITVKRLKNLSNLDEIQLLYFDKSASLKFTNIYTAIGHRHILLVSKGYPYGKSMINFVMDEDKVQYELNEAKCDLAGLKASKVLTIVAVKSEKEWNGIISKFENLANTGEETVEISTEELNKVVKEQKRLLNEIGTNSIKIDLQKEKLKTQSEELKIQSEELKTQSKELTVKENQLLNTKKDIDLQQILIATQLKKIDNQEGNLNLLTGNVKIKQEELLAQQKVLEKEARNLIEIQKEYRKIESTLKNKELVVGLQGQTINAQGNEIITKADKIEEQKSIIWLSILFLLIVSALGIMAYRSYRLKNAANILISVQKEEIEEQHDALEEQHREITDSINYAKRIQDAILPPLSLVHQHIPDSFILYQPKDIVAGDFYWMEKVDDNIIFAAADCTGHGVPGAMVSVVCHNAMNRSVREFKLIEPSKILDKTRDIVVETFEKGQEDVRDGMDIALCTINKKTKKLFFSGANNGLYFIRNGELTQYKADKQPIGKYDDAKPFTQHEIDLEKGDVIYTFSDGYPDQFGGEKGKKYMYKKFRDLLLSIHHKPMEEQHQLLVDSFENWRGNLEQVDDVCIIGVKI
jgi:serine phosphatase RsbU (regulator of sigma subunit)